MANLYIPTPPLTHTPSYQMSEKFQCHRCRHPLILDESIKDLSNAQQKLMTSSNFENVSSPNIPRDRLQLYQDANANSLNNTAGSCINTEGSFVLLQSQQRQRDARDAAEKSDNSMSKRVKTLEKVFQVLSDNYQIDFPVCFDCANLLIDEIKHKFDQVCEEKEVYYQFLRKLKTQSEPNRDKAEDSLKDIETLTAKQKELEKELDRVNLDKETQEMRLATLNQELENLKIEEEKMLHQEKAFELEMMEFEEENGKLLNLYEFNLNQLDHLRKLNPYNEVFNISHDGVFGTINSLRLGYLDSCKVSWREINAALGHFVLLLKTLCDILNLKLDSYKLKPMGSFSKIEKVMVSSSGTVKRVTLELFHETSEQQFFSLSSLFNYSTLDAGMVALVDVVKQMSVKMEKLDPSLELPYKMNKDKVGGLSIKPSLIRTSSNQAKENWTLACKNLLTNAKWLLACASARCG